MSAKWDGQVHNIFIDLCEDEIRKGNRHGSHFNKIGWANMEIAFNERTGRDWSKKQLKNHWDQTKKEWVLFKSLMRGESGLQKLRLTGNLRNLLVKICHYFGFGMMQYFQILLQLE